MRAGGCGIAKNDAEAAKYFRLAAEQGLANAQLRLAVAIGMGRGVAKSEEEGTRWLRKAAEQGDAEA